MHGHSVDRCECGVVMAQCRCIGPKPETIVRPCRHPQAVPSELVASLFEPSISEKTAEAAALTANYFERRLGRQA